MAASSVLPAWSALLVEAVSKPGIISDAYSRFWSYSPGNQLLAWYQCHIRGLELGPINTFVGWRTLGRHVKGGQKAITLCMPVTIRKRRDEKPKEPPPAQTATVADESKPTEWTRFVFRPNWFVLSQTNGQPYTPLALPAWAEERALPVLGIEHVPFQALDGNAQGYASGRKVAVSPVAFMPHRTLFHELAHVVLGHTAEGNRLVDGEEATPRDIREAEAECVALICCASVGLAGAEFSRGYIQHWLRGNAIPDRSAQRIFKAADQVLKAGRPATPTEAADPI